MLALKDQLKNGRAIIAHAKYVDKESVEILAEVHMYISVNLFIIISFPFSVNS